MFQEFEDGFITFLHGVHQQPVVADAGLVLGEILEFGELVLDEQQRQDAGGEAA